MTHTDVAVIGSGFGGLAAVHRLRQRGIRDVVVLERGSTVGGTWRDNHYPGAACDVPSHLYSLSFAPNPGWSRTYSGQPEIQAYLESVADRFDIRPLIRFGHEVIEARWDPELTHWVIDTSEGTLTARHLISAAGALADPVPPDVPGLDSFQGALFHSAQWDHDVSLAGKRVAVVGTGASAIQIVPAIQPLVGKLVVLQRTPPWIVPRTDRPISGLEKALYRWLPLTQRAVRFGVYMSREALVLPFLKPNLAGPVQALAKAHLRRLVPDPELRERLTPDYRIGCKRILPSNEFYPALSQSNVEVVSALAGLEEDAVITADGQRIPVDVVILSTGFDVQGMPISHRVVGPTGETLWDRLQRQPSTYLGTSFNGFPNFHMLLGPNTGLGHTSQVFMIEQQVEVIADLLAGLRSAGAAWAEPLADEEQAWTDEIDGAMDSTVWTNGGCGSWYLNEDGRNTTLWPGTTLSYRRRLRQATLASYRVGRRTTSHLVAQGG